LRELSVDLVFDSDCSKIRIFAIEATCCRLVGIFKPVIANDSWVPQRCRNVMPESGERYMQPGDFSRIHRPLDWIGINHYSPVFVKAAPKEVLGFVWGEKPAEIPLTPNGWPIMPNAFRDTLLYVSNRYALPVYVLENGFGGRDKLDQNGSIVDAERIGFSDCLYWRIEPSSFHGRRCSGLFRLVIA
jgi:beta-glucosidase